MMDTVIIGTMSYFHGGFFSAGEDDNTPINEQDNCHEDHKIEQFDQGEPVRLIEPGNSSMGRGLRS